MDHAAPLYAPSRLRRLAAPLYPLSCLQDVKLTHTAKLVLVSLLHFALSSLMLVLEFIVCMHASLRAG